MPAEKAAELGLPARAALVVERESDGPQSEWGHCHSWHSLRMRKKSAVAISTSASSSFSISIFRLPLMGCVSLRPNRWALQTILMTSLHSSQILAKASSSFVGRYYSTVIPPRHSVGSPIRQNSALHQSSSRASQRLDSEAAHPGRNPFPCHSWSHSAQHIFRHL
jgi:hypothetical protein